MSQTFDKMNETILIPSEDKGPEAPISNFELISTGVGITTLSVLGTVGNMISLLVLSRPQMHSSINCSLQGLAIFDTGVLVCALVMLGLTTLGKVVHWLRFYTWVVFPFIVPVIYPIALIAQTGSVWMTVIVTVERYVAVCHPLQARSIFTYKRSRFYIIIVTTFAVCYNIPRFWEIQRREILDPVTNSTVYNIQPSTFRENKLYFEIYYIWMYLLMMYFIPLFTLVILNTFIWRTVKQANRYRQKLSLRQQKEISLATMLLCVVVVFLICNVTAFIVNILEYFDVYWGSLANLSNLLVTLNSSVNFIIYCIYGHKFKQTLFLIFCKQKLQRTQTFTSGTDRSVWIRFQSTRRRQSHLHDTNIGRIEETVGL
ncbi:FMRFamide receptor-like [Limulus polyphemus]|uniref:FMRFamide receptor-like n=1 Tax=Limulus polyphemus TaxID=6850 RepID=A0ABM1RUP1_LIMPO|nr:FMRFamide receptor-like [Limulus polyphemus]